jgi:hypothetical protein
MLGSVYSLKLNKAQFHKNGPIQKSAMSNVFSSIQIDEMHSRAICQEIGERLRIELKESLPLPPKLARLMERLVELDYHNSPSIVPATENADALFDECAEAT